MRWSTLAATATMMAGPSAAAQHDYADKVAVETGGSSSQKSPEPTAAPIVPKDLFKRQNDGTNTCGFVDGNPDRSVVCNFTGAECQYEGTAIGCCWTEPNNCRIFTACLPYASSDEYSSADQERTQYCSASTAPYCAMYEYMDPRWRGYTMQVCNSVSTTNLFYFQPFGDGRATTNSGELEPASSTSRPTSASEPGSETTTTTTTSSAPTEKTDEAPASAGTPVGAIVGGVVGGVAGIALLGFLAWFLLIRRKKNAGQQTPPPQTPQPFQQQQFGAGPAPGGPHPPVMMQQQQPVSPPLYDNRMSTFKPSPDSFAAAAGPVSPTGSPPIPYGQSQAQVQAHGGYYGDQVSPAHSPSGQQPYPPQQQQQQQQQYQAYQPPAQQQQQQQYGGAPHSHGPPAGHANAVELPSTRPDGELRELA